VAGAGQGGEGGFGGGAIFLKMHDDAAAARGEELGDGAPDAARGAGDECVQVYAPQRWAIRRHTALLGQSMMIQITMQLM
jgi:hypothetical protein